MKKTRTILRVLAALMAVMLMTVSGAPALAASFKAKINSSSAKVYNVPSTSSKVYVQGGKGVTVTVTAYANGWARIKYNGNTGYTLIKNLNLVNRPKGYTKKSTPVYRQDSTSSTRLGTLSMGSTVYVVGVSGNFYRVQNASGTVTGYVQKGTLATKSAMTAAYKKYLAYVAAKSSNSSSGGSSSSSSSSASSSSSSSSGSSSSSSSTLETRINAAINLGKQYIGVKYSADANPPYSFNCSVFVRYCYERYGIDMKGTAKEQAADTRYAQISLSNIKRGDILCFDTDDEPDGVCDHTAIYLGDNQFIESSRNSNAVQINELTSYYRSRFLLARRPKLL